MQQTQKYKLNLIESSDPFLPEGLNQNTQKLEDLISAHQAAVEEVADGLDQRLQVFEAKKFAYGICVGANSSDNFVSLGFTPIAVIIHYLRGSDGATALGVAGQPSNTGLDIVEGGFQFNVGSGYDIRAGNYSYIAFG